MANKEIDITKTGPTGYRQLQQANALSNPSMASIRQKIDSDLGITSESMPMMYNPILNSEQSVSSPLNTSKTWWGDSAFDNSTAVSENTFENIGDVRANAQPWYSKVVNGLAKGAILAGTTFLDGTAGLLIGAGTAINEGRWSGLWDNDFSKAMQAVTDLSEEYLPNYYTKAEQENPWYENIFSANFLGDKFLKNLGFTVGAYYSGSVWAKGLQLTKAPNLVGKLALNSATKEVAAAKAAGSAEQLASAIKSVGKAIDLPAHVTSGVGAVLSAVNEGRIEALNNSRDWYNLHKTQIDDYFRPQFEDIEAEYEVNKGKALVQVGSGEDVRFKDKALLDYETRMSSLKSAYEEALARLNEDRLKMGNADLLMNIPILIASNVIQFGKLYANGYRTARKGVNVLNKGKYTNLSLQDAWLLAEKEGIPANQFLKEFAQFGSKEAKKGFVGALGKVGTGLSRNALPEGLEEISQKAGSAISGDYYATDIHNFYKAKTDPEASQETLSWLKAFAQGINETWNEGSSWEEFFIGALTGALGMPVFGSANTSSSDTYLGKGKAVGLRGGIFGNALDRRATKEREENIANYINSRLQSPEFKNYYQGLIRHEAFQQEMNLSAENGDEFNYKNAEHKQLVSDIMMFDNAGKIGDLLTLINAAYDTSPENLASIVKNTTSKVTINGKEELVGPFAKYATLTKEGEIAANFGSEEQQKEMADKLTQSRDEILGTISDYQLAKDEIDILTGQRLNDDQLQELTWIKTQSKNWLNRGTQLAKEARESLNKIRNSIRESGELLGALKTDAGAHQKISKKEVNGKTVYVFEDNDTYNKLSDAQKRAVSNVAALDSFLGENDEDLFLALGSPRNSETVEGMKSLLREVTVASPTEVTEFERALDDISKLRKGINSYNTKLEEYLKNPEKQAAEMAKADKENIDKDVENKRNAVARRINFDAPTSEVAKALEENSKDILAMGGFDEFIKDLPANQKRKARAAKRFSQALNSIRDDIDASDLTDEQKRIANSLLEQENANSNDVDELAVKIAEALDNGSVEEQLTRHIPTDGVDDLEILARVEEAEAKLKDFFDNTIKKAADAISSAEKAASDALKKAADAIDKEEGKDKSPEGLESKVPKEAKSLNPPKEPTTIKEFVPAEEDSNLQTDSKKVREKNAKPIPSPNPGIGGNAYYTRPQLSEFYLHGRNALTYLQYIKEHPEDIPQGVNKEAFIKYVEAVDNYLNNHGAFVYVSEKLKVGDPIEFKTDSKLNDAAGVPVVLMITKDEDGNEQVIGSLPTSIDFEAINKKTGKKEGEVRVAQKALYEEVIKRENSANDATIEDADLNDILTRKSRSDGDLREPANNLPDEWHEYLTLATRSDDVKTREAAKHDLIRISEQHKGNAAADAVLEKASSIAQDEPITTKVSALRGGRIEFSDNLEQTISNLFNAVEEAPVIAIYSEETSGLTTNDTRLDSLFIQPTASSNAVPWGVYAMIPTNNGKYLPALCWSTKLSDIVDDPDDWYIKQTIDAIKKIPRSIADLNDNIKAVYKWLPLRGFSIQIGRADGAKFTKETKDVSKATHVRISFSNSIGRPDRVTLNIIDGELNDNDVRNAIREIIKKHPDITTNVDIRKLTNSKEHQEYRKNIARYLHSNAMYPHSVNDWFNYTPTEIERGVSKKDTSQKEKDSLKPEMSGKGRTITVKLDGVTYNVSGTYVEDSDGNPVSDDTRQRVIDSMAAPTEATPVKDKKPENKSFTALNMGSSSSAPKIGSREARARRFGSKKLAVTDTEDSVVSQSQIYQNVEKVKQMFPQLSDEGRIIVVNGLIKTVDDSGNPIDAYGEFRDGILYISSQSPAGTAYHEAFHYVTDMLLSDSDKIQMFEAAKERYGEMPEIALEEKLAEDFRYFMNGFDDKNIAGRIKSFFRNLKHIIDGIFGRVTYLDNLFFDIYKNRYQEAKEKSGRFSPRDENIYDEYQSKLLAYKTEQLSYDKLDKSTRESLEAKKVSKKDYEKLNIEDKESILFCLL